MQRFIARERFDFGNGVIGYGPGGPFDCLGPYAKVQNCPIHGTTLRRTCYATNIADTFFSVPACTRYKGRYIKGYFTYLNEYGGSVDGKITFCPINSHKHLLLETDQYTVI